MKNLAIIGNGRFGKTLKKLLQDDFTVSVYTREQLEKAYQNDIIFYAVPIAAFEDVIATHKQYFRPEHILIDVLSVKMHPAAVFEKHLKGARVQALLTHPMFGPDSSKDGFENLPIILDKFMASDETFEFWKTYFAKKKLKVIEMSAQEHDRLAADSQGLTHFIGRVLDEFDMQATVIDTVGAKKLLQVKEQTCNDTWELFTNLQQYNLYTKGMRIKIGKAYDKLYNKLLPRQVHPEYITIGIQGGKGSFNEEALLTYLKKKNITKYKIEYLYTSTNVLKALHEGNIDQGQFAIHNSLGGIVQESLEAMAAYTFTIIEKYSLQIAHALMIRSDAELEEITTIMTHPQVLAQCKDNLAKKYPTIEKISGEGEFIDPAFVAQKMGERKLPKNIATISTKVLAAICDLKIVEDNLQDLQENYTTFVLVER